MLTVLTIDNRIYRGKGGKLLGAVSHNSLKVQVRKDPVAIRHLRYINRRGKINWNKIAKAAGQGRARLIYSGEFPVPEDTGIKVFEPFELRQRLCGNMALAVLDVMRDVPKKLRIGLYDPQGEYADLPEHFLKYTDNLIVVTKNYNVYREQADRLLTETGAVLCVSPHISLLSTCGFIISPSVIDTVFTPQTSALVLSSVKPSVPLSCRVYYKYSFHLEKSLMELKPQGLDTEIFAGGLYSFCGFYALGSLVPLVCSSDRDTQTTLSLRRYLSECFST